MKFKTLSKDCSSEIRHLEKIQKLVDSLNKYYLPKSTGNKSSSDGSI